MVLLNKGGVKVTSRERLLKTLNGELPDRVPVAPDTSNMIPARLTGKPFWDLYLYQDPPIWKAYIDCVKYFGFDSMFDGFAPVEFEELGEGLASDWKEAIVYKDDKKIITRRVREASSGKNEWEKNCCVYFVDNPPVWSTCSELNLPETPTDYQIVEKTKEWPKGEAMIEYVKSELGDHGIVGVTCGRSCIIDGEWEIYEYYDNPEKFYEKRDNLLKYYKKRLNKLLSLKCKPDYIAMGWSGSLIFQTKEMFRELSLPIVKELTAICKQHGMPSHIHSCGPETYLVKCCAEETDLTSIDPLEIPPMGDCNLKELKKLYGHKLVLKGNLHTTDVMLNGTRQQVIDASRQAIEDAAEGGRFILSTGDQCGRDTPYENIFAMIEAVEKYGRY